MNPWTETIHLPLPLRDLHVVLNDERERRAVEKIREAYERGLRDGERRLSEQLVQQRAEMLELQNGVFTSLRQTLPQVTNECQESLVGLALQVAGKLVADMPINAELVEAVVQDALSHVEQTTHYQIMLNPADLELLKKFNSPAPAQWTQADGVEVLSSPEVTRGGCIVHTRFGVVDARRETKLSLLQETLQNG